MLKQRRRTAYTSAASQSVVIVAPVLTWTGDTSDSTPDFDIDIANGYGAPRDTATNDVLRLEYSANAGSSWNAYLTHTMSSGEITGTPITVTGVSALAVGSYLFRARVERGTIVSAWSASVSATVATSTTYYTIFLSMGQY